MKKPTAPFEGTTFMFNLISLAIIILFPGLGCGSDPQPKQAGSTPSLVIIGEDLSGTFNEFPSTTEEDLNALCASIAKTKDGGKVYFIGIGSSTPKGYAHCSIRPFKTSLPGDPPFKKKEVKHYNAKLFRANEAAVNQFLISAATIFQQRKQDYTDINGFFKKARSIVNSPNHARFKKWLYINSDGKQDTPGSKKVDCDLLPRVDKFFVNRGWDKNPDCNAAGKLPDTPHFIEYFTEEIETQTPDQNDF